ncbi:hypothetical protein TEA_000050 [Camellia sinensis var. sinensis]|uniref:Leucine-rich repeat-containing N-terminal plant-type domain-containing protein n=1 Tax=Camellia sinensis var. sinensis TaxID=542762 RepID=A0A4S4F0R6_CAMSN|nr:hypothetical protein TEA_000050 [Camellia sinensis var. sinensis]
MELAFAALILACLHSFVSPDAQGDALYALRKSLNASVDQLKDWNPNQVSPSTWSKVSCISNNVVSVSLTSMGFSGILSPKIEVLKTLQTLTKREVDQWLFSNSMQCPGALHFVERNAIVISYGLQTNSTLVGKQDHFEDPTFKFQIPLQIAAEREIARSLIGDPKFSWVVSLKEFAHPALQIFSAVGTVGPTFFLVIAMFGFVFQISSLIAEKELKLRQAMTMMGLYDTAYWFSWLTWEGIITLISSLLTVLFGMILVFPSCCRPSLASHLHQQLQVITQFGFPYSSNFSSLYRIIWSLFPPNLLAQGLKLLSDATATPQDPGISWSRKGKCAPNDNECVVTISEIYIWLISTFLLWFVLAIYFDNINPNSSGVRKSVLYFLNPGYWTGKGGNKVAEGGICSCTSSVPPMEDITPDDEDVLEEENTVKKEAKEGAVDPNIAVQIRGLVKVYPGATKIGCCKCKKTSHYHALKVKCPLTLCA